MDLDQRMAETVAPEMPTTSEIATCSRWLRDEELRVYSRENRQASRSEPLRPGLNRGSGYDAVLRWEHSDPEPDLAGFMVVVRSTTAPDWEREIWAGNVREFTLKDIPIDQFVFGVKSVDQEGHESAVSGCDHVGGE